MQTAAIPAPVTGPVRRRRRRSADELQTRMVAAAMGALEGTGLTVSVDGISFEDVIQRAGVSRSAAYRRWPYKDLFFADLLRALADTTRPTAMTNAEAQAALIHGLVSEHLDALDTAEGRRQLAVELFRQSALLDVEIVVASPEWRTYFALLATFQGLADSALRGEMAALLARSEAALVDRVATAFEHLAGLLGHRLRPETGASYTTVAQLGSALVRGLVVMALSTPGLVSDRRPARPFGAAAEAEWSLAALGLGALADAFLEPDPAVVWDGARRAAVHAAVADPATILGGTGSGPPA